MSARRAHGWTLLLGFGWCGFGFDRAGLLPELRLGVLRVAWCRGWLWDAVAGWRDALVAAKGRIGA